MCRATVTEDRRGPVSIGLKSSPQGSIVAGLKFQIVWLQTRALGRQLDVDALLASGQDSFNFDIC